MKKSLIFLVSCLLASPIFADDLLAKAKEIINNKDALVKDFGEEDAERILYRVKEYVHGYEQDNCSTAQNDPLCDMIKEELDVYINEIIPNKDKARLEQMGWKLASSFSILGIKFILDLIPILKIYVQFLQNSQYFNS